MKNTKLQILTCTLQALFWMLFCATGGFINAFLTKVGIAPNYIGIIAAASGALSALLQPIFGGISDRCRVFQWDRQICAWSAMIILCYIALSFVDNLILIGVLTGGAYLLSSMMMPLVNGASFYYERKGVSLNFGVARGFGSLFYSILSFFLGGWMASFGNLAVNICGIIISALMIITVLLMMQIDKELSDSYCTSSIEKGEGLFAFAKRYPKFMAMLVGFILYLLFHNISCTYMLQLVNSVGGNENHMGKIFAIAGVLEIPILFFFSYIIKRISSHNLLIITGFAFCMKAIIYIFATNILALYLAQFFQIFSFAIYASASVYYANEVIDDANKQRGQALIGSATTLGGVLGNLIGGAFVSALGIQKTMIVGLLFAAAGTILVTILKLNVFSKGRNNI